MVDDFLHAYHHYFLREILPPAESQGMQRGFRHVQEVRRPHGRLRKNL